MPNLASRNQSGHWYFFNDSQAGVNGCSGAAPSNEDAAMMEIPQPAATRCRLLIAASDCRIRGRRAMDNVGGFMKNIDLAQIIPQARFA